MKQVRGLMGPLEKVIRDKLLPSLFGEKELTISDDERSWYALPGRFSGLAIGNPVDESAETYAESWK